MVRVSSKRCKFSSSDGQVSPNLDLLIGLNSSLMSHIYPHVHVPRSPLGSRRWTRAKRCLTQSCTQLDAQCDKLAKVCRANVDRRKCVDLVRPTSAVDQSVTLSVMHLCRTQMTIPCDDRSIVAFSLTSEFETELPMEVADTRIPLKHNVRVGTSTEVSLHAKDHVDPSNWLDTIWTCYRQTDRQTQSTDTAPALCRAGKNIRKTYPLHYV